MGEIWMGGGIRMRWDADGWWDTDGWWDMDEVGCGWVVGYGWVVGCRQAGAGSERRPTDGALPTAHCPIRDDLPYMGNLQRFEIEHGARNASEHARLQEELADARRKLRPVLILHPPLADHPVLHAVEAVEPLGGDHGEACLHLHVVARRLVNRVCVLLDHVPDVWPLGAAKL